MTVSIGGTTGQQERLYCMECDNKTLHESDMTRTRTCAFWFTATIMTCGIALPLFIYSLVVIKDNYVCQQCGLRRTK